MAACAMDLTRIYIHVTCVHIRVRSTRIYLAMSRSGQYALGLARVCVDRGSRPPVRECEGSSVAMELREVNRAYGTAEETTELLPQSDNTEYESYFIEYAMQKEMINRNRCPASRRLLSQVAQLDYNVSNSNHLKVGS